MEWIPKVSSVLCVSFQAARAGTGHALGGTGLHAVIRILLDLTTESVMNIRSREVS